MIRNDGWTANNFLQKRENGTEKQQQNMNKNQHLSAMSASLKEQRAFIDS